MPEPTVKSCAEMKEESATIAWWVLMHQTFDLSSMERYKKVHGKTRNQSFDQQPTFQSIEQA